RSSATPVTTPNTGPLRWPRQKGSSPRSVDRHAGTSARSAGLEHARAGETFDTDSPPLPGPGRAPPPGGPTVGGTVDAALVAFVVVFVAEVGDKTQLVALGLAARYPLGVVLTGITLAYAITQGLAALLGGALGAALPTTAI